MCDCQKYQHVSKNHESIRLNLMMEPIHTYIDREKSVDARLTTERMEDNSSLAIVKIERQFDVDFSVIWKRTKRKKTMKNTFNRFCQQKETIDIVCGLKMFYS